MAPRFNAIKIQMLSSALHKQVFGIEFQAQPDAVQRSIEHLKTQRLWGKETPVLPDVDLCIPTLHGGNIESHFLHLGEEYCKPYKRLLGHLTKSSLPDRPKKWNFTPGWTRYEGSKAYPVSHPLEEGVVLDVEVCQKNPNCPTLATAASRHHWYSWCSESLVRKGGLHTSWRETGMSDLIPLEADMGHIYPAERLIIGHNVSYDRAFIREQYLLADSPVRFLDTMSLHMCVSGLTGVQRAMSLAYKNSKTKNQSLSDQEESTNNWLGISSLNNLADVYNLYCPDQNPLTKELRHVFISGSIADVRDNFQDLVTYCSDDVIATHKILVQLMPMFYERFPHPVTLAGMLEMSVAYLPVNEQWQRYLRDSQETYEDLQGELKLMLGSLAQDACALLNDNRYHDDPWLWNLDWSVQKLKCKKNTSKKVKQVEAEPLPKESCYDVDETEVLNPTVASILATSNQLYKTRPHMPGYPAWYRDLCLKLNELDDDSNISGPFKISTQVRQMPKIMRLMWEGHPLHYDKQHGWGYLVPVPKKFAFNSNQDDSTTVSFPLRSLLKLQSLVPSTTSMIDYAEEENLEALLIDHSSANECLYRDRHSLNKNSDQTACGPYDVGIPGCIFYRLPHKDGPNKRVGNPLSKDFLRRVSEGTLRAGVGEAQRALTLSNMASYWRNTHKRILSQMVIWLDRSDIPSKITRHPDFEENCLFGAILPRLVVAGTVTRRAVEPTWLTASNAYADRVGSELKAMIHCPPGHYFVGADVDAQELWIASILGDGHFAGMHGSTAFGWMTLQGDKTSRTDLHSKTADTISISRDQAKVLNYARIYGAGEAFATRLLMQFNKELSLDQAKEKARKIYSQTKGLRKYHEKPVVIEDDDVEVIFQTREPVFKKRIWTGGSESSMFNCLESIAQSENPTTPVLGCRISRALEPTSVDRNFLTSRINWVVQSSAVDYLHLILVCMHWLMKRHKVEGRFSLSIHDEVRYLVPAVDKYQAALCLQITNLLVRSLFAHKIGMSDLPQSVAFFSAVDIDVCLRKEVHLDCQTPSCPRGLLKGYNIPPGESLDIHQLIKITGNALKNTPPPLENST